MGSQLSENNPRKKEQDFLDKQPLLPWGWLAVVGLIECGILVIIWKLVG